MPPFGVVLTNARITASPTPIPTAAAVKCAVTSPAICAR